MSEKLKVLILEDCATDAELILRELRQAGFEPEWKRVETESEYLAQLEHAWEIILGDYNLPQFTGLRALELLQERGLDLPFILVSGMVGEDKAVAAMKAGASDYVMKDKLARLPPAVKRELRDASERRKRRLAEERLQEQAAFLDAANDAIYVQDLDLTVLYWNRAAERLYGWPAAEAVGQKVAALGQPDGAATRAANRALLEQGNWSGELHQTTKGGKSLVVFSRWTLLLGEQGQPRKVLVINADLTEKKQLEARLLRAQRLESLGLLASGIAHDLNNLLSPILMAAPMLRWHQSGAEFEKVLCTIESSAQHAAQVIKQVLTFGRGTEGDRVTVQLKHLLRDVAKIAEETFPRSLKIAVDIPRDLWVVTGNPTELHQAVLNLCVNARDAMPQGGLLTIGAKNAQLDAASSKTTGLAPCGQYVVLEVKDTGHGIPTELLDSIFMPFFTTKPLGKGTGLGLATVLGIVKSHGGLVNVESEPGRGACFQIFLPAKPGEVVSAEPAEAPPHAPARGELILVVDDEAPIRETVQRVLVAHGYRVLTARDGAEALSVYGQHRGAIAAVLTDLMMPNFDGASLIHFLRHTEPGLPILASTGLASTSDPGETLAEVQGSGVAAVLRKPYVSRELLTALEHALEERRALKGTA